MIFDFINDVLWKLNPNTIKDTLKRLEQEYEVNPTENTKKKIDYIKERYKID